MTESFLQKGGLWIVTQNLLCVAVVALGPVFPGQWHSLAGIAVGGGLFLFGVFELAHVKYTRVR